MRLGGLKYDCEVMGSQEKITRTRAVLFTPPLSTCETFYKLLNLSKPVFPALKWR